MTGAPRGTGLAILGLAAAAAVLPGVLWLARIGGVGANLGALVLIALPVALVAAAAARHARRTERSLADLAADAARATPGAAPAVTRRDPAERASAAVRAMRATLLRKIAELDAERSVLASVIEHMRGGLVLVAQDRRIRLANDGLRRIFDVPFPVVGHLFAEVVRHPRVIADLESALSGNEVPGAVLRLEGSDRAFEVQMTGLPAAARSEREVLVLFFDVTRLEALEAIRREFVANVSHELRTPLTSIKAFVETLLDGALDERDDARRFLEIVRRHTDRMGALIEDLTDLSKIETGAVRLDRRPVDAALVAREVAEALRAVAAGRGVTLDVALAEPVWLDADRQRLEQMLTNLVGNAIKFNRPGGRVAVRVETLPAATRIRVEDDGVGIPAASQDKIFNRFYQVDAARSRELGGTGLGLAIVKHLMRLHGGTVRVRSELGVGSTFTLEFPTRTGLGPAAE